MDKAICLSYHFLQGCFLDSQLVLLCCIEIQNPLFKLNPFIIDVQELTPFTSSSSLFYPQKNSFIMFPAWLEHGIPKWEKDEDRYSIAMNIHPVGQYGLATSSMYIDPNTVK